MSNVKLELFEPPAVPGFEARPVVSFHTRPRQDEHTTNYQRPEK